MSLKDMRAAGELLCSFLLGDETLNSYESNSEFECFANKIENSFNSGIDMARMDIESYSIDMQMFFLDA